MVTAILGQRFRTLFRSRMVQWAPWIHVGLVDEVLVVDKRTEMLAASMSGPCMNDLPPAILHFPADLGTISVRAGSGR